MDVYSEKQICDILSIRIVEKISTKYKPHVSAKDIVPATDIFDETHPLYQKKCVFTGVLDQFDRKTAMQYVANVGGLCKNGITKDINYYEMSKLGGYQNEFRKYYKQYFSRYYYRYGITNGFIIHTFK